MEPVEVYAGATWTWETSLTDFQPSDGWSLEYICTNASGAFKFESVDSSESTAHTILVSAVATAAFQPGEYVWQLFALRDSERRFVSSGNIKVFADITSGETALDSRSHVKKTLDALEALIEGRAGSDKISLSIAGRSVTRMSPDELLRWRAKYRAEYRQEQVAAQIASGRGNPNAIKATFRRPI